MDRIIEIKVCGTHLTKDSNNAGTKGEANMTRLRITFDENWEDFAKQVIFWDAYGQNPVKVVLGVNLIEDIAKSTRVYLVPIPAEAMARAGSLTFSIQGSLGNKNQVSITSKLEVADSPDILDPLEPTPSELEQMQAEIEAIKGDITDFEIAHRESVESAELAKASADRASATVGKTSYIGDNGNWYAWSEETLAFYDTGIKAQAGSTVCVGSTPQESADVWINPNENNVLYIRNENGEFIPIPTIAGKDGKSAYDQAVDSGYTGTLEQFTTLLNNLTYTIEGSHLSDTSNPHKVTAQQVGALPITGGVLTGSVLGIGSGAGQVVCGPTYSSIDAMGDGNKRRMIRVINPDLSSYPLSKAAQLHTNENGKETEYNLYGEHNKPKASDVGAVPTAGGTLTGPLVFDSNVAWGQIVMHTSSGHYRGFEASDDRARIDVRDGTASSKRRYLDIYPIAAEPERSKALRFGQSMDGETKEAYVLHTENINDFVVSSGSYEGDGNTKKTIPIRKTTQVVIIHEKYGSGTGCRSAILVRGAASTISRYESATSQSCNITWADDSVTISDTNTNLTNNSTTYFYTLIG